MKIVMKIPEWALATALIAGLAVSPGCQRAGRDTQPTAVARDAQQVPGAATQVIPAPTTPAPTTPAPTTPAPATAATTAPVLPNPAVTPGAVFPVATSDVCRPGYSRAVRNVPASVKREAYVEYRIATHQPGEYEVDHLIPLELGGSNSLKNLWPESFLTEPWNARVKDAIEVRLHNEVCNGSVALGEAQKEIAANWILAYQQHFHTSLPRAHKPPHRRTQE